MNAQEQLFLAIGGADPELVARSERRRRKRWVPCVLAAAACLVLVLAVGRVLPLQMGTSIAPPDIQEPPSTDVPNRPGNQDPDGERLVLPEQGHEIGTLRLLSYTPETQDGTVDFLIYVNEEQFYIQEENGLYSIRSTGPLPENFPECGMDVFHLSGATPEQARAEAETALKERYPEVSAEELWAVLPGSLYLRADKGTEWDSEVAELWFVDDGRDGTFVLTARYFLEAEEGLGLRFRDMASSFRAVERDQVVPDWMRELYAAADRLAPALFAGDLSGVSDLLTEEAEADAYGENAWADISIISVDYTLDNDQDPAAATVSVKHRRSRTEGDSFSYLTMELVRRNGSWYLEWSGIEK